MQRTKSKVPTPSSVVPASGTALNTACTSRYLLQPLCAHKKDEGLQKRKADKALPDIRPEFSREKTDSSDSSGSDPDQDSDYQASQELKLFAGQRSKHVCKGNAMNSNKPRKLLQHPDQSQSNTAGLQSHIQSSNVAKLSLSSKGARPAPVQGNPACQAAFGLKAQLTAQAADRPAAQSKHVTADKQAIGDGPDVKLAAAFEEGSGNDEEVSEAPHKPVSGSQEKQDIIQDAQHL